MNVAVINLKDLLKYIIKIILVILLLMLLTNILYGSNDNILKKISIKTEDLLKCYSFSNPLLSYYKGNEENKINIINFQLAMFTENAIENNENNENNEKNETKIDNEINTENKTEENNNIENVPLTTIEKIAVTEPVTEKNIAENYNLQYNTVKIRNQSDYTLTQEMLVPDIEIGNINDILIYHTHTCESYTPSELYNYTMTGNYRTTDNNYNMIRVGTELEKYLTEKGFNVIHDGTYHDYPSYSGSYDRSLETAQNLLYGTNIELVFDIHRDAVGAGDAYGPTVKINGEKVAQMMFVIGTSGGGMEHPNWNENLKIAIKIQEKANEIYPGLFRPIIVRNSRYNQHIARGAAIIEVGATGNTLEECLLSMQCLANVLEELR